MIIYNRTLNNRARLTHHPSHIKYRGLRTVTINLLKSDNPVSIKIFEIKLLGELVRKRSIQEGFTKPLKWKKSQNEVIAESDVSMLKSPNESILLYFDK